MTDELLNVLNLVKHFPLEKGLISSILKRGRRNIVHAVCNVSFSIRKGETFGLVGESGSGKTTIGRCILKLYEPTSGQIIFKGQDLTTLNKEDLRKIRREMQIVFQDPYTSLNPREKVIKIIGRPLKIHGITSGKQTKTKVIELLKAVGLRPELAYNYPHQLSGGQKQRVAIARAIATNPEFIVLDEAVSAVDVSIRAKIINLLFELQKEYDLTYLFISHDLDVVRHISDRVAVMYLGKLMELAPVEEIFSSPKHPYTKALLSAIPIPDPKLKRERIILKGELPSSINPPKGCRFHTRCPFSESLCKEEEPHLRKVNNEHLIACHLSHRRKYD